MAKKKISPKHGAPAQETNSLHPGSSADDAKKVGGKGDFGVPESDVIGRTYTSINTKMSDPGATQPRSGEGGGRTSGAGSNNSGPGSGSGGDLDASMPGLGNSGGVATSGNVNEPPGPDDTDGTSDAFASGGHAQGNNQSGPVERVRGTVVQPGDDRSTAPEGADASANSDPFNDATAGEISSGEASGEDNA